MTTKPVIELRKVKVMKTLSEETPCYTADVYVDGRLFCHTSNHGHGGCDMQHAPKNATLGFNEKLRDLEARIKATHEPIPSTFGGPALNVDLELLCHMMLNDVEVEKAYRRAVAKKVLFTKADGKVYQIGLPASRHAEMIAVLKGKPDVRQILNELPLADALAIYKAA